MWIDCSSNRVSEASFLLRRRNGFRAKNGAYVRKRGGFMRQASALFAVMVMTGCASRPQLPTAGLADKAAAESECARRYPGRDEQKPITPFIDCLSAADVQYRRGADQTQYAMALQIRSRMLALAQEVDEGRMTTARFRTEVELTMSNANQSVSAHIASTAAADAQKSQALIQAGSALMAPPTVTCTSIGGNVRTTTCR